MAQPKALIIGAGGGIGKALAQQLSEKGWDLVLAGRTHETLEEVASQTGGLTTVLDATDFDAVASLLAEHPDIRHATNLAGSILLKSAHQTSEAEFMETINQNLKTAFSLVRACGLSWRQGGGSIVLMSTCASQVGLANHEAIAAAKAGVEGLTRSAAASYATRGVRCNAVAPGLVETPLASRLTSNEGARKASEAMHPLGRIGTAEEVARLIAFLLDPANDWMTGQIIGIDGGLSRVRAR
ncbi:MAG: 2-deoxy-D-gluconate 3-dehydrogenase [Phycisphaerae bacterium]|nr:2-deoxy-D-gluconate 3-dehydrogenase [Phycisphaerae bacterium]|tara:strand:+ start:1284 stop:2006 length:723 start_codon:yes stop_codon:yes gene_type:complete